MEANASNPAPKLQKTNSEQQLRSEKTTARNWSTFHPANKLTPNGNQMSAGSSDGEHYGEHDRQSRSKPGDTSSMGRWTREEHEKFLAGKCQYIQIVVDGEKLTVFSNMNKFNIFFIFNVMYS